MLEILTDGEIRINDVVVGHATFTGSPAEWDAKGTWMSAVDAEEIEDLKAEIDALEARIDGAKAALD